MVSPTLVDIGLFAIVLIVLVGPFMVRKIEHNLEAFLFVMGVLAVTIAGFESRAVLEAIGYNHEQIAVVVPPAGVVLGADVAQEAGGQHLATILRQHRLQASISEALVDDVDLGRLFGGDDESVEGVHARDLPREA
mgnify:CR=1 FL=1